MNYKDEQIKNKTYVWKKGKRKIVCEITPIDKYYLFQRKMEMESQMTLAGFRLVQSGEKNI